MSVKKLETEIDANTRPYELPGRRFRALTVGELLARPAPKWLVQDVMPDRGLGVLFGASGSGKTFATFDLSCAVARGLTWFGRGVDAGAVLYVATEGNLALRARAYLQHHAIDAADLDRLRIVQSPVNLLHPNADLPELIAELEAARAQVGEVALVVVDTLNRAMNGGNENASEDMGAMISAARRIEDALQCLVLYVHHGGKDESRGSRGHSSLKAAADVELSIKREPDDVRIIVAEKVRDGEDQITLGTFRLERVELDDRASCVVVPAEVDRIATRLTQQERRALSLIHEAITEHGTLPPSDVVRVRTNAIRAGQTACPPGVFREHVEARGGVSDSDNADTRGRALRRALQGLQSKAVIQVFDDWIWLTDTPDMAGHP